MACPLIWTEPALADLDAIADYIALENPPAARRLVARVFARVDALADLPEMGPRIPELRDNPRYRQLSERPLRVFYRFDPETKRVLVLAVMRTERLFRPEILARREKSARRKLLAPTAGRVRRERK